jgi:glycosyltransferase involved in cell wall biosynthesis
MSGEARRLKILVSAYSCRPGVGSEPGTGWNLAAALSQRHDVWILTRERNRPEIEAHFAQQPIAGISVVYHDLPRASYRWWKRGAAGTELYSYLWQRTALPLARRLHQEIGFDLVHHATFGRHWSPSFLVELPVPFLWGPVGGAESCPVSFWPGMGMAGGTAEILRSSARRLGEADPALRRTVKGAALVLAKSEATAARLRQLGARHVELLCDVALDETDLSTLAALPKPPADGSLRFLSSGRLLGWKGFHLGLQAFAEANLEDAEYRIAGDGPQRPRLQALARRLGVADRVRFLGRLSRADALAALGGCHVLVHPSLHDSSGWVCLEAMAAGRPVICLDLGGPGMQVSSEAGIRAAAARPRETVRVLADAMRRLADPTLRASMGAAGQNRVRAHFSRARLAPRLDALCQSCLAPSMPGEARSRADAA